MMRSLPAFSVSRVQSAVWVVAVDISLVLGGGRRVVGLQAGADVLGLLDSVLGVIVAGWVGLVTRAVAGAVATSWLVGVAPFVVHAAVARLSCPKAVEGCRVVTVDETRGSNQGRAHKIFTSSSLLAHCSLYKAPKEIFIQIISFIV